ncbi:hypothetical protein CALCODRAFT_508070 [Calocera cornea HHB12733]|uniref:Uncharacterized protein n=1 Tax=Calocera cornea HHB12733 TaxID=1353952 RepID=A0A165GXM9_9BASI|nr:hypothetical protein CALCODRAFT_508070 [Calocera cornea HHB12733]
MSMARASEGTFHDLVKLSDNLQAWNLYIAEHQDAAVMTHAMTLLMPSGWLRERKRLLAEKELQRLTSDEQHTSIFPYYEDERARREKFYASCKKTNDIWNRRKIFAYSTVPSPFDLRIEDNDKESDRSPANVLHCVLRKIGKRRNGDAHYVWMGKDVKLTRAEKIALIKGTPSSDKVEVIDIYAKDPYEDKVHIVDHRGWCSRCSKIYRDQAKAGTAMEKRIICSGFQTELEKVKLILGEESDDGDSDKPPPKKRKGNREVINLYSDDEEEKAALFSDIEVFEEDEPVRVEKQETNIKTEERVVSDLIQSGRTMDPEVFRRRKATRVVLHTSSCAEKKNLSNAMLEDETLYDDPELDVPPHIMPEMLKDAGSDPIKVINVYASFPPYFRNMRDNEPRVIRAMLMPVLEANPERVRELLSDVRDFLGPEVLRNLRDKELANSPDVRRAQRSAREASDLLKEFIEDVARKGDIDLEWKDKPAMSCFFNCREEESWLQYDMDSPESNQEHNMVDLSPSERLRMESQFRSVVAASWQSTWTVYMKANRKDVRDVMQGYIDADIRAFTRMTPGMVEAADRDWLFRKKQEYEAVHGDLSALKYYLQSVVEAMNNMFGGEEEQGIDETREQELIVDKSGDRYISEPVPSVCRGRRGYLKKVVPQDVSNSYIAPGYEDPFSGELHKCNTCIFYYLVDKAAGVRKDKRTQCGGPIFLPGDASPACYMCIDGELECEHFINYSRELDSHNPQTPEGSQMKHEGQSTKGKQGSPNSTWLKRRHTLSSMTKEELKQVPVDDLTNCFGKGTGENLVKGEKGRNKEFGALLINLSLTTERLKREMTKIEEESAAAIPRGMRERMTAVHTYTKDTLHLLTNP